MLSLLSISYRAVGDGPVCCVMIRNYAPSLNGWSEATKCTAADFMAQIMIKQKWECKDRITTRELREPNWRKVSVLNRPWYDPMYATYVLTIDDYPTSYYCGPKV